MKVVFDTLPCNWYKQKDEVMFYTCAKYKTAFKYLSFECIYLWNNHFYSQGQAYAFKHLFFFFCGISPNIKSII